MMKSARIGALLAGFAIAAMVQGAGAQTPTSPPTDLKFVDGHWTPWDPPQAGEEAYRIVKGDTLWDLAQRWLGDPFLWPQIWDENRYVLDSHWIYPGDPLVIPGRPLVVPEGGPPESEIPTDVSSGYGRRPEPPPPTRVEPVRPALQPVASISDVYCSGFIEPDPPEASLSVVGTDTEKEALAEGDIVYLSQGRDWGLQPGDEFAVLRAGDEVLHPASGRPLGTHMFRSGKVRVLLVHDTTATAVITMSCRDVSAGDELRPWTEIPIPVTGPMTFDRLDIEPSGGAVGQIVSSGGENELIGEGHVMHTDLGVASGVRPGTILKLFAERGDLPRLNLGQAVVITVEPGTSTAMVTHSVREAGIGDSVEVLR